MDEYLLELEWTNLYLETICDYLTLTFTDNPHIALRLTEGQADALCYLLETETKHSFTRIKCLEN